VAFASFLINKSLYVSSIAVYTRLNSSGGYRLVYPSKLQANKEVNIFYPVTKEAGNIIETEINRVALSILNKRSNEYDRFSNFNSTRS